MTYLIISTWFVDEKGFLVRKEGVKRRRKKMMLKMHNWLLMVLNSSLSDFSCLTKVITGNINNGGFANDMYVNKASSKSGYTPREDHVEPNMKNTRPNTTGSSDIQKGPELISYANKLSPSGKVTSVKGFYFFKFPSTKSVDSMLRDGPRMIRGVLIFLNKWSPSARSDYARILIEIDAYNGFSNNLVMAGLKLDGTEYTKETIRIEYEWKLPHCSTCLIFGHLVDDCPKSPKRVVNKVDKGIGASGADDEGFIEVKKKKYSEKINKFEQQMLDEICVLVDDDGNPLEMVDYSGDHDSEGEVALDDNEMTSFMASKPGLDVEIPNNIQCICDNLDIKVRGRKKK
nr:hypothetical protein [Tanacetum cinerariifolium]